METIKKDLNKGLSIEEIKDLREKKVADMNAQQKAELMRILSIRERLERKLKTDVVELSLKDDLGDFKLKFRKLNPVEHDKLIMLNKDLKAVKDDPDKTEELTQQIYNIISSISLDDLDQAFWKSGTGYSADIFVSVLLKVLAASTFPENDYLADINKFRT